MFDRDALPPWGASATSHDLLDPTSCGASAATSKQASKWRRRRDMNLGWPMSPMILSTTSQNRISSAFPGTNLQLNAMLVIASYSNNPSSQNCSIRTPSNMRQRTPCCLRSYCWPGTTKANSWILERWLRKEHTTAEQWRSAQLSFLLD